MAGKKKKELSPSDTALENAKGKFEQVVVIGLDARNNVDISSSSNSYVVLQWLLNRASFELLIHEKAMTAEVQQEQKSE